MKANLENINACLDIIMGLLCDQLPEDWEMRIICRHEEADIELYDPEGDLVEHVDDDSTVGRMLVERVDFARESDGLEPTDILEDEDSERDIYRVQAEMGAGMRREASSPPDRIFPKYPRCQCGHLKCDHADEHDEFPTGTGLCEVNFCNCGVYQAEMDEPGDDRGSATFHG